METSEAIVCAECIKENEKNILMGCITNNGTTKKCISKEGKKCKEKNCPSPTAHSTSGICWTHIHWRRAMEYQRKELEKIYAGEGIA